MAIVPAARPQSTKGANIQAGVGLNRTRTVAEHDTLVR